MATQGFQAIAKARRLLVATSMGLLTALAAAQTQTQTAPPPVESFFQHPAVLQAKLSPSGRSLAISTSRGGQRVGLVVLELDAAIRARRVAAFNDADITRFDWVGEESLVFQVHDLQAGSGMDYERAPGLYAVRADGSQLRMLVRRRGEMLREASSAGRREPLDWNHSLLHIPDSGPLAGSAEILIGEWVYKADRPEHVRPLWLDTSTGRTRSADVGERSPTRVSQWLFDPSGRARLAVEQIEDKARYHWRDLEKGWQPLAEAPLLKLPYEPFSVDDAGTLYVRRAAGKEGYQALYRYDFKAGQVEKDPVASTPGFDFAGDLISDAGQTLGLRVATDAETTVWFAPAMRRFQAEIDASLPGTINHISCRRCGEPDMVALIHAYSDREPGRYWLYHAASKRLQAVSTVVDGVDPRQSASVDFQRIKARDGRDLPVWITLPRGVAPGQPAPAVVMVHGGPWVRGGHWRWEAEAQFLASRGYLVISPEFRGSTGYGEAHFRAGWKQWGQAMQDDVADALLWARAQGLADPQRACIAGASYGGYATLMGLIRHPELYRCGIAWVAVTDMQLLLEGSSWVSDDTSEVARRHTLPEMIGDLKTDAALLREVSPVLQAARIKAPLMLAFGSEDQRVPLAHGLRMRDALRAAGREPEWIVYAGEGHGWRKTENRVDFYKRVERFLAQHLGQP